MFTFRLWHKSDQRQAPVNLYFVSRLKVLDEKDTRVNESREGLSAIYSCLRARAITNVGHASMFPANPYSHMTSPTTIVPNTVWNEFQLLHRWFPL